MYPYFYGCGGKLVQESSCGYVHYGIISRVNEDGTPFAASETQIDGCAADGDANLVYVLVEDLPCDTHTNAYMKRLHKMLADNQLVSVDRSLAFGNNGVHVMVGMTVAQFEKHKKKWGATDADLDALFGTYKKFQTNHMVLLVDGEIKVMRSELHILDVWMQKRFEKYADRKRWMLRQKVATLIQTLNKHRFVEMVTSDDASTKLVVHKRPLDDVRSDLERLGFEETPERYLPKRTSVQKAELESHAAMLGGKVSKARFCLSRATRLHHKVDKSKSSGILPKAPSPRPTPPKSKKTKTKGTRAGKYDYLLNMRIADQTKENMQKLENAVGSLVTELCALAAKTPRQLWLEDIERLESKFESMNFAPVGGQFTEKKGQAPMIEALVNHGDQTGVLDILDVVFANDALVSQVDKKQVEDMYKKVRNACAAQVKVCKQWKKFTKDHEAKVGETHPLACDTVVLKGKSKDATSQMNTLVQTRTFVPNPKFVLTSASDCRFRSLDAESWYRSMHGVLEPCDSTSGSSESCGEENKSKVAKKPEDGIKLEHSGSFKVVKVKGQHLVVRERNPCKDVWQLMSVQFDPDYDDSTSAVAQKAVSRKRGTKRKVAKKRIPGKKKRRKTN